MFYGDPGFNGERFQTLWIPRIRFVDKDGRPVHLNLRYYFWEFQSALMVRNWWSIVVNNG